MPPLSNPDQGRSQVIWLLFAAAVVVIARALFVYKYGRDIPFWDQWDAEAWSLYRPWLLGELKTGDLFAPHNEHRITTTRLWSLLIFESNAREWSPKLEMYWNVGLCGFLAWVSTKFLTASLSTTRVKFFLVATVFFWSGPFAWENTLSGFQAQFYWMAIFSLTAVYFGVMSDKWLQISFSLILCVFGFFSLSGGAMAPATIVAARVFRSLLSRRINKRDLFILMIFSASAFIMVVSTPEVPGHAGLRAQSIHHLFLSLWNGLSWPLTPLSGLWVWFLPWCILISLLFLRSLAETSLIKADIVIVAIGGWAIAQILALAYGRSEWLLSSRYMDIYVIGLLANVAAMLRAADLVRPVINKLLWVWLLVLAAGISPELSKSYLYAVERSGHYDAQIGRVNSYMCNGDAASLRDAPYLHIPYPDWGRLKMMLDDQVIRGFLPKSLISCH